MQLENPKRRRIVDEILAGVPEPKRTTIVEKLMRLDTALFNQHRRDTEVVESLIRILEHPAYQRMAERLRNLIINSEQK